MHCPFCGGEETKVIDSRLAGEGRQIPRRRQCLACNERFTTFETAELVMPRLIKNDGTRQPFDENKLRSSMVRALEKRPVNPTSSRKRSATSSTSCPRWVSARCRRASWANSSWRSCARSTRSPTCDSRPSIAASRTSPNSKTRSSDCSDLRGRRQPRADVAAARSPGQEEAADRTCPDRFTWPIALSWRARSSGAAWRTGAPEPHGRLRDCGDDEGNRRRGLARRPEIRTPKSMRCARGRRRARARPRT